MSVRTSHTSLFVLASSLPGEVMVLVLISTGSWDVGRGGATRGTGMRDSPEIWGKEGYLLGACGLEASPLCN